MQGIRMFAMGAALVGGLGCSECFVRGTRVLTPRGPRNIEDLAAGDEIWSWDTSANRPVRARIGMIRRSHAGERFEVAAGELRIAGVTAAHPFFEATTRTWIRADALALSARVLGWLGEGEPQARPISSLRRLATRDPVEVFNLSVVGEHENYFAEGILVHNKSIGQRPGPLACAPDAGGIRLLYSATLGDGLLIVTASIPRGNYWTPSGEWSRVEVTEVRGADLLTVTKSAEDVYIRLKLPGSDGGATTDAMGSFRFRGTAVNPAAEWDMCAVDDEVSFTVTEGSASVR